MTAIGKKKENTAISKSENNSSKNKVLRGVFEIQDPLVHDNVLIWTFANFKDIFEHHVVGGNNKNNIKD